MHMDISQELFYARIFRKNAGAQNRGPHFVRACAVETHMDMSQEPFYARIYRKIAGAQGPRSRKSRVADFVSPRSRNAHGHVTRAILWENLQAYPDGKNPSVWTHCLGNKGREN